MHRPSAKLIAASAGSGKTFQLTKRYIELLMSGDDISTILAITFTENAAKEMKSRITTSLKEIALNIDISKRKFKFDFKDSQKATSILDNIFERYNQFHIKTIDSFITSIFSSSAFEFGYDFDFSIRFNYTKKVEKEIFNFFSKKIYENQTTDIDRFIEFLNQTENVSVFDPTYKIINFFSEFLKKEDDYISQIRTYSKNQKTKYLEKIKEIKETIFTRMEKLINIYGEDFLYKDIVKGFRDKDINLLTKKAVSNNSLFKKGYSQDSPLEYLILNLCKEYIKINSKLFYMPYSELYSQFRQYFLASQKKSNEIILSSMVKEIHQALNELKDLFIHDTFIKLSSIFKHFLIDEFQDTSYAQWSIIKPFVEESLSKGGSLFLIGDVKQAIYMFRNADYRIMKDMIENSKNTIYLNTLPLENGIEIESIGLNYRSSHYILEYVNNVFSSDLFKKYLEDEGLEAFKNIYTIKHTANEPKDGYVKTVRVEESKIKEKLIETILDLKDRMPLSSIAILTYRNDTLDKIAQWLGEEKIPVISYGELDIRKNQTVRSILTLLKFLNNPSDEFSFSLLMLMPQIMKNIEHICSRNEIESMFIEANIKNISKIETIQKRYPQVWGIFSTLIDEVFRRDIYSLTNLIISKLNITQNFPKDNAYILKLLDVILELIKEESIYSLNDFITFIENSDYDDERFSAEISQTIDAIKLFTFHKSKGLEFDAVINVFWPSHKGGPRMYYEVNNDGINIYALNKDTSNADEKLREIYTANNMDEKIAEINIIYVALTRAKKELYNIVVDNNKNQKELLSLLTEWDKGIKTKSQKEEQNVEIFEAFIKKDFNDISTTQIIGDTKKDIGKLYHKSLYQLFSQNTNEKTAIKNAFLFEGILYKEDIYNEILKLVKKTLKNRELSKILKNSLRLLSEAEFSDENGNIMRSDLIAIGKKDIYVIDFKTGEKNEKDIEQLLKYIKTLKSIYKQEVFGLIYYVKNDEVIKLKDFNQARLWKEL